MTLDFSFAGAVKAPVCVAPMFLVSSPTLVIEACASGLLAGFPAHTPRTADELIDWIDEIERELSSIDRPAPWAMNIVLHRSNPRYEASVEICLDRRPPIVLTSKGAPRDVFSRIHEYGGLVFHDVSSARHAAKAAEAGADALIAIAAGAGGKTGTLNPFALLNELRSYTDLPIILAGGISTGRDVFAAQAMGAAMAYVGTRFIAAKESLADEYYRSLIINSSAPDILVSAALDGAPSSWLIPSVINEGVDLNALARTPAGEICPSAPPKSQWRKIRSAGQGAGSVCAIESTRQICEQIIREYEAAREEALTGYLK